MLVSEMLRWPIMMAEGKGGSVVEAGRLKKARIDQRPVDQGWDDDDIGVAKIGHLGYQNVEKFGCYCDENRRISGRS